jgi:hypothetical protein
MKSAWHGNILNMLTCSWKRPRPLAPQPTLAELVVVYLPEEEFSKGDTLNNDSTLPPGPTVSILDEYHYKLLLEQEDPEDHPYYKEDVDAAWKQWQEWGKYEHGERWRQNIFNDIRPWRRHRDLWKEIQIGMFFGNDRQRNAFYSKWVTIGLREMKSDKDWMMWKAVTEMGEVFRYPAGCRKPRCMCTWENQECLGNKIYD